MDAKIGGPEDVEFDGSEDVEFGLLEDAKVGSSSVVEISGLGEVVEMVGMKRGKRKKGRRNWKDLERKSILLKNMNMEN